MQFNERKARVRTFNCPGVVDMNGDKEHCGKEVVTSSRARKRCDSCAKKQIKLNENKWALVAYNNRRAPCKQSI